MALNNEDLFLVNQGGDTKKIKYENLVNYLNTDLSHPIHIGDTEPTDPNNGELWVDTSECPPKLMIYSECDGAGWIEIEGTPPLPEGDIDQPMILAPSDGAGPGTITYLKSDAITDVEGGGIDVCETDLIQSVNSEVWSDDVSSPTGFNPAAPPENAFNLLPETIPPQVADPGDGTWNAGAAGGNSTINVDTSNWGPYLAEPTGALYVYNFPLNVYPGEDIWKVNGVEVATINGMDDWVKLADDISTVLNFSVTASGSRSAALAAVKVGNQRLVDGNTTLTFPSSNGFDCFEPGDVVQGTAGGADEVKVISKDDSNPFTITVDGGDWLTGAEVAGQNRDYIWSQGVTGDCASANGEVCTPDFNLAGGPEELFDGSGTGCGINNGSVYVDLSNKGLTGSLKPVYIKTI